MLVRCRPSNSDSCRAVRSNPYGLWPPGSAFVCLRLMRLRPMSLCLEMVLRTLTVSLAHYCARTLG